MLICHVSKASDHYSKKCVHNLSESTRSYVFEHELAKDFKALCGISGVVYRSPCVSAGEGDKGRL